MLVRFVQILRFFFGLRIIALVLIDSLRAGTIKDIVSA